MTGMATGSFFAVRHIPWHRQKNRILKRVLLILLVLVVGVSIWQLWLYNHAKRSYDASQLYAAEEINAAMDVAETYLHDQGCVATKLWYDEERSQSDLSQYSELDNANSIVIYTNFALNPLLCLRSDDWPDGSYSEFSWVLSRENSSAEWTMTQHHGCG